MRKTSHQLDQLNPISYGIIGCAFEIHRELGPGLLESTYETCLTYLLREKGYTVESQKVLPVTFRDVQLDAGYRIDLLVEHSVIIENKAVKEVTPLHQAQLMTYLKLSKIKLGLILNFNVADMRQGITRLVM